mmetsp:Transcript_68498/g.190489  ORF Transcript_68498/g.190489 Transcript_68498/m.190489 type:complete len:200 (-) Transcript_68498:325-924(-)
MHLRECGRSRSRVSRPSRRHGASTQCAASTDRSEGGREGRRGAEGRGLVLLLHLLRRRAAGDAGGEAVLAVLDEGVELLPAKDLEGLRLLHDTGGDLVGDELGLTQLVHDLEVEARGGLGARSHLVHARRAARGRGHAVLAARASAAVAVLVHAAAAHGRSALAWRAVRAAHRGGLDILAHGGEREEGDGDESGDDTHD